MSNDSKCPLPRIGSKDWGWQADEPPVERSEYTGYYVNASIVYAPYGLFVATCVHKEDAKRIAELLARRDWRRENRGKR